MNEGQGIGLGYAYTRLHRALKHELRSDGEEHERARARVDAWWQAINRMALGELVVGSRTPVADTPAWVTLEVLHGGFASGSYVAGGALQDWERDVLATLPAEAPGESEREKLNLWYLGDDGQEALLDAHSRSRVKVAVPEEGALLCVALLIENDYYAAATALVDTLVPWFDRLRFYPQLTAVSQLTGATVHRRTAHQVAEVLANRRQQEQVAQMVRTLTVWNPLYDRLVELWSADDIGSDAWNRRRAVIRVDVEAAGREAIPRRFRDPRGPFQQMLRSESRSAAAGPLARAIERWGVPGTAEHAERRARQARDASLPLHGDIARVVADRLWAQPAERGIDDVELTGRDVQAGESEVVAAGTRVPEYLVGKTRIALEAPVAALVRAGVIGSGEVLAEVIPQMVAAVTASGIEDARIRSLYSALYAAFRARRSLLLVDYVHQVRFEELPWVRALDRFRSDPDAAAQARLVVADVLVLYMVAFPQTQLPNPLITELSALAKAATIEVPLVEEIAADIFMGDFTAKFGRAAELTSQWLEGTLYARYWDLPVGSVTNFGSLCRARSSEAGSELGWVAQNGAILEQALILTTHNLAPLCRALELEETMRSIAPDLVPRVAQWITEQLDKPTQRAHDRLRNVKNAAYAWRQLLFFLSFVPDELRGPAIDAVESNFAAVPAVARMLRSTIDGLRMIHDGARFGADGTVQRDGRVGRRLLGWSLTRDFD